MGYSRRVPITVRMKMSSKDGSKFYGVTPAEWRTRTAPSRGVHHAHGKPTVENLRRYVEDFEESTKPGEANEHLGEVVVIEATIVREETKEVLARYPQ